MASMVPSISSANSPSVLSRPIAIITAICGTRGRRPLRREGDVRAPALAENAASRYRALGWPLLEAQALEAGGRTAEAADLYRSCGSTIDVRRLEMRAAPPAKRGAAGPRLSPREREVATLVAKGSSNRKIADTLSVGEKTVEKYVTTIYAKLGVSTRAQLAAHVARSEASTEREPV